MDSREQRQAEDTLREFMEALPHDALTRVVEAERWVRGAAITADGRCLLGHVGDARLTDTKWEYAAPEPVAGCVHSLRAALAFDALCAARGIAYVVALVQSKAAVLLHDREEAVVASLLGEESLT